MENEFPIIAKLGGAEKLGQLIRPNTLRMWRERGAISRDGTYLLMEIADARGVPYSRGDFQLGGAQPSSC